MTINSKASGKAGRVVSIFKTKAVNLAERPTDYFRATAMSRQPVSSSLIRGVISERRRRDTIFPSNLFSDPAWDMLLALYAMSLEQQRITITSLCASAAVPPTTALRWIDNLKHVGLIARQGDPLDARRVFIELSSAGRSMLDAYFQGRDN